MLPRHPKWKKHLLQYIPYELHPHIPAKIFYIRLNFTQSCASHNSPTGSSNWLYYIFLKDIWVFRIVTSLIECRHAKYV